MKTNFDIIFNEINAEIGYEFPKDIQFVKTDEEFSIDCFAGKVTVKYFSVRNILRAALILKQRGRNEDFFLSEKNNFQDVCLMVDCSRNGVMSVKQAKSFMVKAAMLGYNSFMLYTEDTYEVNNEPEFGYLRGRYTKAELKDLDAFSVSVGIELIPCIQTLAHLNTVKRWYKEYMDLFDIDDVLLCGGDRTKKLICNILDTLKECFTSRRIHIGMDEAPNIGRGAYLDKNGYKEPFDILIEHLTFIANEAKKRSQSLIMWSDMFFKMAYKKNDSFDEDGNIIIPKNVIDRIPNNVSVCHWDYSDTADERYLKNFKIHKCYKTPVWWAGSSFKCFGFFPSNTYSLRGIELGLNTARQNGIKSVINTLWGDNGAECSNNSALPCVTFFAYKTMGYSLADAKKAFFALTGYKFDQFVKLEYPNTLMGKETRDVACPTSNFLYNDLFSGQFDCYVTQDHVDAYKECAKFFKRRRKGKFSYIFETAYRLCDAMTIKADLGIRLRRAYKNKDVGQLKIIVDDISVLIKKLDTFMTAVRTQWLTDYKPNGLEVQEFRIGGLKERLSGCKKILVSYINGELKNIPELEVELLNDVLASCSPFRFFYNSFVLSVSNNNL